MDRYVGLDAHARSCTLGVIGPSGKRLKSMVVETNGQALVEAVRSISGRVHLCLEEGTQSAWLYELLAPHVEEVVVVVPPERKGPKDDLRDAWGRADELRTGAIQTRVYKAPQHLAALRNAVRAYGFAVRDVVRAKNRLKSVFLSRGRSTRECTSPRGGASGSPSCRRRIETSRSGSVGNWTACCRYGTPPRSGCAERPRPTRSSGSSPRRLGWESSARRRRWP
jgi:hypothetical protein